ncbi:MAG TPA: apolipoprotein N-acyltransferase [Verrucomicrobiae bacterium]|nr:apolipoprotein N-acyltransferase [Verrucomicrobiae bacterium]
MSQSPENQIPLVVDMDGTIIKTDIFMECIARLLRRNPFSIFQILFWWTRGRAHLKHQLGRRVKIDAIALPYNEKFLTWLREQKIAGRKIILATAADIKMALPVANHLGIFDEVMASEGVTNLRSHNKLKALVARFGERGFDYAGNSVVDLGVWPGARKAIVVNASRAVARRAAHLAEPGETFLEGYSPFEIPFHFFSELFLRSGYLLSIVAGILLALAFPKANVEGFAWIAPALLVLAAKNKSGADAFRIGYAFGLAFWLSTLYWLLLIPVAGFPILGWLSLCAFLALFSATWLWLVSNWKGDSWIARWLWSLGGAAVWVALEMLRARLLGGFPWSFMGVSQAHMTPLIQFASFTGVYGISFLIVWTSLSLFSAVRMVFEKPKSRFAWQPEIALPLFAVAGLFASGEFKMQSPSPDANTLRLTLIQPSIPQNLIWDETANSNRFQQLLTLSENALTNPTDLLVWPESAVPESPEVNYSNYTAITGFVKAHHVWLIFNSDDFVPALNPSSNERYDVFNSAFLFSPDGKCAAIYHKQKLVMFGEYIPLARWLPFVKWLTPITGGFAAGDEPSQFEINSSGTSPGLTVTASPLICFEDTFPQLGRRATKNDTDFLVNLTNDGWFGDSAEQWQHEANAIFRAVENNVPLIRCCNNGVTCWIDAHGRVREIFRSRSGDVYGPGAMTVEMPVQSHAQTFYNRHGDWFGWICVIWTIGILARQKISMGAKPNIKEH